MCTDLAARGLDIPEIDHVIMFDFPLNPVDYIHRLEGERGRQAARDRYWRKLHEGRQEESEED